MLEDLPDGPYEQLLAENETLRARLEEAEEILSAIRSGGVDALVISGVSGEQVFTLKGADHLYRVLVDDMHEGALTLTMDGVITYANHRFAEMVKLPLEKVTGTLLAKWVTQDSQATLQTLLDEDELEKRRAEVTLTDGGDNRMLVNLSVNRLVMSDQPDAFCVVASDLTEQKQRFAELQRVTQMKNEFMAAVSHELRTPLMGVLGMADALEMQAGGPLNERQVHYVQSIRQSGERLLSMVNSILRYTGLLGGQAPLRQEPCHLDELCSIAMQSVRAQAAKKKLMLELNIEPVGLTIISDADGIIQMLQQLLDNAVKFTPAGGRIGLSVCKVAGQDAVNLVVWDTGIGITDEQRAVIFQPFVQGDAALSRNYSGIGLGLAYVQHMVELLGGTLALESAPGAGSRFTATLPCC